MSGGRPRGWPHGRRGPAPPCKVIRCTRSGLWVSSAVRNVGRSCLVRGYAHSAVGAGSRAPLPNATLALQPDTCTAAAATCTRTCTHSLTNVPKYDADGRPRQQCKRPWRHTLVAVVCLRGPAASRATATTGAGTRCQYWTKNDQVTSSFAAAMSAPSMALVFPALAPGRVLPEGAGAPLVPMPNKLTGCFRFMANPTKRSEPA